MRIPLYLTELDFERGDASRPDNCPFQPHEAHLRSKVSCSNSDSLRCSGELSGATIHHQHFGRLNIRVGINVHH
jgi:hypothetical protein